MDKSVIAASGPTTRILIAFKIRAKPLRIYNAYLSPIIFKHAITRKNLARDHVSNANIFLYELNLVSKLSKP